MKHVFIFFITVYQQYVSILLTHLFGTRYICRYPLTCSEYAKQVISKKGVIIGGYLACKRIVSCQPYATFHGKSF